MALPQSAVSDLLEVLRTGEAVDLIRESVRTVLQELIEAEARSSSVPPVTSGPSMRPTCTCATAPRRWCRWPSWWRPASPPTAVVRSSGSTWATARTRCSGAASSPR